MRTAVDVAPVRARISVAACSARAESRQPSTRFAPAAATATAVANPMPELAPVTTTVRSSMEATRAGALMSELPASG